MKDVLCYELLVQDQTIIVVLKGTIVANDLEKQSKIPNYWYRKWYGERAPLQRDVGCYKFVKDSLLTQR